MSEDFMQGIRGEQCKYGINHYEQHCVKCDQDKLKQQAEQIERLEQLNTAFSHELRTYTELNTKLQDENKRLKDYILERSNWEKGTEFIALKQHVKSPNQYEYYLVKTSAAPPQKG